MSNLSDEIDEILFPPAGVKNLHKTVEFGVLDSRPIDADDLEYINKSVPATISTLKKVTYNHHNAARLIVQGKSPVDVAVATGYSVSYVKSLQGDPTFRELLDGYQAQKDVVFADVLEQMRDLGLDTLAELRKRLEEGPEKFTIGQLQDQIDLLLVKGRPQGVNNSAGGPAGGVQVNVQFVTAIRRGPIIENRAGDGDE